MTKIIKFGNVAYDAVAAIQEIDLAAIDVPENRARSFDPDEAAGLAASITEVGLLHPIRVRLVGNRHRLIAGRKRLEACRLLGWSAIPVTISDAGNDDEERLEEVVENLASFSLNKLDRCQHLYEFKQVYERLHPEAKHGGDRGNQHTGGKAQNLRLGTDGEEVFAFAPAIAEKIGMSRRAIELAVKIWTDLTILSRIRLAGTRFADHQSALKDISEQAPAVQAEILDLLLSEPPAAQTVADAAAILRNGSAPTPAEKKAAAVNKAVQSMAKPVASAVTSRDVAELKEGIATLSKFMAKLEDEALDSVVAENEERIIASLKRRGRI